jgi:hypothetical protein
MQGVGSMENTSPKAGTQRSAGNTHLSNRWTVSVGWKLDVLVASVAKKMKNPGLSFLDYGLT